MKKCWLFFMAIILIGKVYSQVDSAVLVPSSTLLFFRVQPVDNVVLLKWSVQQSEDYKSFDIERAVEGKPFIKVGSKLAISKSSNADYDFVDATPKRNAVLHYRLKLIANDGTVTYSSFSDTKLADARWTARLKQNPVRGNIAIEITAVTAKQVSVKVVSHTGQQVAAQTFRLSAGLNQLSIAAQSLLQGVYQLIVEADMERQIISFIKE